MAAGLPLLVVEDDADSRQAFHDVLQPYGYVVATASSGTQALEILRMRPEIALILLDLVMPHMNGWEFLGVRQADPALRAIPVVVVTAFPELIGELPAVARVLPKPLELDMLLQVLREESERRARPLLDGDAG